MAQILDILFQLQAVFHPLIDTKKLLQELLRLDVAYLPIASYSNDGLIQPENFAGAIKGLGAIGGAISKDIKGKIIPFLDRLDPFAEQIQAVNTVIREGQELVGYNTDAHGFEIAISDGIKKSGINVKTALVYGYGGVFNVVYHVLKKLGITVFVTGRRAAAVAEVNQQYGLDSFDGTPKDLFVNATPITDSPLDQAPLFIETIKGSKMTFDHHMPGKYLKSYCQENRIYYLPGTTMYYPQMYKQWALFLKEYVNEKELPELIGKVSN